MIFFAPALAKYMEKNPNTTQLVIETYFASSLALHYTEVPLLHGKG